MMDLRDLIPGYMIRHRNRCEPMARVPRRKPDIYIHDDIAHGEVYSIAHLTRSELENVWRVSEQSVHLCGMRYAIGQVLGKNEDEVQA